ncbi:HD domain-containing protein [Pseudodesulfovibrio sp. JC047]|uniref:HD domain-containing protein n=1 Tax=Pseudodesulfovibrio sp. JC047 TaxID=2683199 RepID=UPI0013D4E2FE|nr:HD domain-containing protein [Pseudodesulfovibrio sp. JC047]NDV20578.1 HD domain-containing protein [Pseudodesulfovibrio sp. JC047]
MDLSPYIVSLTQFANTHLKGEADHDYHITLKLDHSLRVLQNAQIILEAENISGHTADLAQLAALFHDIGRFPQYAQYGTFKDSDSINHGRLGVLTLRDHPFLDTLSDTDARRIKAVIGLHNVKQLAPSTPEPVATLTKIVRDADKIDIIQIVLDHLSPQAATKPVVIHDLINDPLRYSDALYDAAFNGTIGDITLLRYCNDFILLLIGWLAALNYATSVSLIAQRGLVERAFSLLPDDAKIVALRKRTDTFVHNGNHISE